MLWGLWEECWWSRIKEARSWLIRKWDLSQSLADSKTLTTVLFGHSLVYMVLSLGMVDPYFGKN